MFSERRSKERGARLAGSLAVFSLLVPLLHSAWGSSLEFQVCGAQSPECLFVEAGEHFELGVIVDNPSYLQFGILYLDLQMPDGLTIVSWNINHYVDNWSRYASDVPNRFIWDCSSTSSGRVPVVTFRVAATTTVAEGQIVAVDPRIKPCGAQLPVSIGSDALEISSRASCPRAGGEVTFSSDRVEHYQFEDQYQSMSVTVRSTADVPFYFETSAAQEGGWGGGWLRCRPQFGYLPPHGQSSVDLHFNTNEIGVGTYRDSLILDVPCARESRYTLPVELTVIRVPGTVNLIAPYFDIEATECEKDVAPGDYFELFIVGRSTGETMAAAEFALQVPEGVTYLGLSFGPDVTVSSGNPIDGIQVAFGTCDHSQVLLARASFSVGAEVSDATFQVVGHPVSSFLGFAVCDADRSLETALGGGAVLNGDCSGSVVSVQEKTWGLIKALYRAKE
jgi:hypothetical protein